MLAFIGIVLMILACSSCCYLDRMMNFCSEEQGDQHTEQYRLVLKNPLLQFPSCATCLSAKEGKLLKARLELSEIQGVFLTQGKYVYVDAQEAWIPSNKQYVYLPGWVKLTDQELSMSTNGLIIDLKAHVCFSLSPTYWKTKGVVMMNDQVRYQLHGFNDLIKTRPHA